MTLLLRPAGPEDLEEASALCLRSKAHWGYDAAFLASCRVELTLTSDDLARDFVRLATWDGAVQGVLHVAVDAKQAWLEKLFVDPGAMGRGIGRALFASGADWARAEGADEMVIEADPGAVPFYRRMGAHPAGQVPSGSVPGRVLPRLVLRLSSAGAVV
ncbi:MAG: GNAT family N-acetyltransferase [Pseudomonadota bacterium]